MRASEMTWQEYRDCIATSIIFLPVGAMEQHGPHLPLSVDMILPARMSELAAEQVGGIVLPTIPYGYKSQPTSGGGQRFPGTTSLNGNTLINVVLDILRETYRHGGRRFVVYNGHYENAMFLTEAIDLFVSAAPDARVMLLDETLLISDEMLDELFADCGFPGWDLEHAAVIETSLMQYFAPELVREDRIVDGQIKREMPYAIFPPPDDVIPESGVLYKATFASREKGEKYVKHVLPKIVEVVRRELGV
jgi:creatinine amidohydrolase